MGCRKSKPQLVALLFFVTFPKIGSSRTSRGGPNPRTDRSRRVVNVTLSRSVFFVGIAENGHFQTCSVVRDRLHGLQFFLPSHRPVLPMIYHRFIQLFFSFRTSWCKSLRTHYAGNRGSQEDCWQGVSECINSGSGAVAPLFRRARRPDFLKGYVLGCINEWKSSAVNQPSITQ